MRVPLPPTTTHHPHVLVTVTLGRFDTIDVVTVGAVRAWLAEVERAGISDDAPLGPHSRLVAGPAA